MTAIRINWTAADKADNLRYLRERLRPGGEVLIIQRHRSSSGALRLLDVYCANPVADRPQGAAVDYLTKAIACLCGYSVHTKDGRDYLAIRGCGFSAGTEICESLSRALWPDDRAARLTYSTL